MITMGGKCLDRNLERLFAIISELLHQVRFSDLEQLNRILGEFRAMQGERGRSQRPPPGHVIGQPPHGRRPPI